jgi:prephenate dehydrogenase
VSASKPRISIIGLGMIGSSIGLALRQAEVTSAVIGHDVSQPVANQAKKMEAVDKVHWNLISACDKSDLIVLALPVEAVGETLGFIGPELKPNAVVFDTASLKRPVMDWADEHLADSAHFVGGDPILNRAYSESWGVEAARADLFQGGLFCLVPSPTASEAAVKLVTDLVTILGATSLFMDAGEHDGLVAGVEHLPGLLALAMLETVIDQPAWRELRKVAGPGFEAGTQLVRPNAPDDSELYLRNKDNLLRWIDALSVSLGSVRELVAGDDAEALAGRLSHALEERQKWMADRTRGDWSEGVRVEMPEPQSFMESLFGSFWRRKPKEGS